ncbi:NAD(P)H-dependent glycerol-3-phosphate dehydrogenase [Atopobium deltae]|uniref:Glycerol-3-phosphate dehydrogenase [NAD(P)+] n=1 Tax=Atopobium deltae TaxID=1393034 RepID=A0A133XS69_9ACTN|nr:NAD(P)H-dependent glycerol-3-phosphate dehydrogenase [Atopobium deltae]KXB33779.1 NAD-dependent glycerol-3-phosphate dehydrogenase [NAD(P)+ ] protein [Atopobium deltae]
MNSTQDIASEIVDTSTHAPHTVCVVGTGSWGTAVAGLIAPHVDKVVMWSHSAEIAESITQTHKNNLYLTDYTLPDNVVATLSMQEALADAAEIFFVVPSSFLRATARDVAQYRKPGTPSLVLTKGMEHQGAKTMTEVVAEELGEPDLICALSGPNHAEEVCKKKVAASVIAGKNPKIVERFQRLVLSPEFRIYVSDDLVGVEVCAAVKNVIAIAAGLAVGVGQGDNTLAVIMTRGLAEIGRIVSACGGDPLTCMGLAGMGDLVATCTSPHSRNRSFGVALAQGTTLEEYERSTKMIVEGARAAKSVYAIAQDKHIEVPITKTVHAILYEHLSLEDAFTILLERKPHEEFYGFQRSL